MCSCGIVSAEWSSSSITHRISHVTSIVLLSCFLVDRALPSRPSSRNLQGVNSYIMHTWFMMAYEIESWNLPFSTSDRHADLPDLHYLPVGKSRNQWVLGYCYRLLWCMNHAPPIDYHAETEDLVRDVEEATLSTGATRSRHNPGTHKS